MSAIRNCLAEIIQPGFIADTHNLKEKEMNSITAVLYFDTLLLIGISVWFTLAIFNNITDPGTNIFLIGQMMNMDLLSEDQNMGNGIQWRAIRSGNIHKLVFTSVVLIQIVVAMLLWKAVVTYALIFNDPVTADTIANAILSANTGLTAFTALWIGFWCGGMWFGYWMKTPQIQQVHMALLILSAAIFLIINNPVLSTEHLIDRHKISDMEQSITK